MEQTLQIGIKPCKEYGKFTEVINRVNDAVFNRESIEMVYDTMSRNISAMRSEPKLRDC